MNDDFYTGNEKRPVQFWMNDLLSGRLSMEQVPPAVRSWARIFIWEGALDICRLDTRDERKAELLKIPEKIRPYVEAEVTRIWPMYVQNPKMR